MLRETHVLNEIFAHRFRGPDPKYALVISHSNAKPILVSSGGKDPSFPRALMQATADATAGPVEFYCLQILARMSEAEPPVRAAIPAQ